MAQLITLSILGVVIACGVLLGVVALFLVLLGKPPMSHRHFALRSGRAVGALMGALVMTTTLVALKPAVLNPICDEFEWFGAKTASKVRHYAYEASAPIRAPHDSRL